MFEPVHILAPSPELSGRREAPPTDRARSRALFCRSGSGSRRKQKTHNHNSACVALPKGTNEFLLLSFCFFTLAITHRWYIVEVHSTFSIAFLMAVSDNLSNRVECTGAAFIDIWIRSFIPRKNSFCTRASRPMWKTSKCSPSRRN